MPLIRDQAICIRHWDWSETSQTVSLFARETGIVRCIAKGAKREKSTFSGGIELLTRGELTASIKSTEGLATLTSWDLLETFAAARKSLSSFHAGMAMLDIVQHAVQDADPHPGFFDAVLASLRRLGSPGADQIAVIEGLWAALSETGHAPELLQDVRGGAPLPPAQVYHYFPVLGGFSVSARSEATDQLAHAWKTRGQTVDFLRALAKGVPVESPDLVPSEEATAKRALQFLVAVFRHTFSAEPSALKQFAELSAQTRP